jgi:hypothetical protein
MEGCQVKLRNVWSWPIVWECHAACTLKVGVCDDFSMEGGQVKLRNVWSWPIVGVSRCLHVKDWGMWWLLHGGLSGKVTERMIVTHSHWGTADDRNCNYCHLKMADVESGKNLFCRLNCFYSEWHMHWYDSNLWTYHKEITNYDWKMYMKEKIRF